jgi:hypothetical protein
MIFPFLSFGEQSLSVENWNDERVRLLARMRVLLGKCCLPLVMPFRVFFPDKITLFFPYIKIKINSR